MRHDDAMMAAWFPDRTTRMLYVLTLVFLVGMVAYQQFMGSSGVVASMNDHDSWVRLARLHELVETGKWYDKSLPRDNFPHGAAPHWTRVVDGMMLALAAPFRLFVDSWDAALLLAGAWFNTVLLAIALLAMLAVVKPVAQGSYAARFLLLAAVLHPLLGRIFAPGVVDHHALLATCLIVQIACMVHKQWRWAGMAMGLGIWVSPEFLLPAGLALAWQAMQWLWCGAPLHGVRRALVASLWVLVLALAVERIPSDWGALEYDTLSIVSIGLMALAAIGIEALEEVRSGRTNRLIVGGVVGALLTGALVFCFPGIWLGPIASVTPEMQEIFLRHISESMPVYASQEPWLLVAWFLPLLCIPMLWNVPNDPNRVGRFLAFMLFALSLLLLLNGRWYGYLMVVSLPALALVMAGWLGSRSGRPLLVTASFMAGALYPFLFALLALNFNAPKLPDQFATECSAALSDAIHRDYPSTLLGKEAQLVLVDPNFGSEMLYFTPHGVLAWNFHRNAQGYGDIYHFLHAPDEAAAHIIAGKRHGALAMLCLPLQAAAKDFPFLASLADRTPAWMTEIMGHPWQAQQLKLYQITPEAH